MREKKPKREMDRQLAKELAEIDKERQPNLYRHAIGDILKMREQLLGKQSNVKT